jgi:hypothetical protein
MKKLSLDLGELAVESFETFAAEKDRGTVQANGAYATVSCGGTCGAIPLEEHGAAADSLRNCCV